MKVPTSLARGAKAPLSFFPLFFFEESLDNNWYQLLDLPTLPAKEQLQVLERSPLQYLGLSDIKILFYYECKQLGLYLKMPSLDDESKRKRDFHLNKIAELLKAVDRFDSIAALKFHELAQSYLHFFMAICTMGNRSRKVMRISSYHLEEFATHLGPQECNSPYLNYFRALIEVGCGQWEKATTILHKELKRNNRSEMARLLCKLYVEIGMPNVARFVAKKYGPHIEGPKEDSYFSKAA